MIALFLALVMMVAVLPAPPGGIDPSSAAPGQLARPTAAPPDAVFMRFATDASVEGYTVSFDSRTAGFTVDATKLHVDRTSLAGVVQAHDVVAFASLPQTTIGPPGPAQVTVVHLRVPRTALLPGMQALVVRSDSGAVLRGGAPVVLATLGGMTPVHVDVGDPSNDATLQRRFDGTNVYGYGPLALRCGTDAIPFVTVNTRPHTTLRVARVERTHGSALLYAGYDTSDYAFAFKAIDPLRVVFDPNVRPEIGGMSFSLPAASVPAASMSAPEEVGRPRPKTPGALLRHFKHPDPITQSITRQVYTTGCRALETVVADGWQIERLMTTRVPAFGLADIKIGQTHEQVASIAGFPSVYATKAELMQMAEWHYDLPAPFSAVVTFDGDRVARYQPPGDLP